MTKEEILKQNYLKLEGACEEDWQEGSKDEMHQTILTSMDEYAKQQGVLFVEWLVEKSFRVNKGVWESPVSIGVLSTDELYDIFNKKAA